MSRSERIRQALLNELDAYREQLDNDEHLEKVVFTVVVNPGGWPRRVKVDRESTRDLAETRR